MEGSISPETVAGLLSATGAARDRNLPILERLAHHLQSQATKFGELVGKKDPVVGKTHLSGSMLNCATQQASVRNGVMWTPKRNFIDPPTAHFRGSDRND